MKALFVIIVRLISWRPTIHTAESHVHLQKWISSDLTIFSYCVRDLGIQFFNGCGPDAEDEGNLVDQIRNVVDDVQQTGINGTGEEAKEIAERIDGPADGDDGTHGVEGGLDGLRGVSDRLELAGFTVEDLLKNVEPTTETQDETQPGVDGTRFAEVARQKHEHGADEETPEDAS